MISAGSVWGCLMWLGADPAASFRMDAPIPPEPAPFNVSPEVRPRSRTLGTATTLFVNFDGLELSECSPSDSKRNCHWYNTGVRFERFSGSLQTRVSILQAMRRLSADFGLRITGARPSNDDDYTMVIYGGTEEDFGALGSAPAGDCGDQRPNEIAFAHLDGELAEWVTAGATTALHEAAHSWGLDHVDFDGAIMYPAGDNSTAVFRDACDAIVTDVELTPAPLGDVSCPELNDDACGSPNRQNDTAVLEALFGPAYVDITAPEIDLVEPYDGQYFQAPAEFAVVLDVSDDLHPQAYSVFAWLGDEPRPTQPLKMVAPGLRVSDLPIGSWDFHVVVVDEAGNEGRVDFTVDVGEDPPPPPGEGCSCGAGVSSSGGQRFIGPLPLGLLVMLVMPIVAIRRRKR